jgi:hypothetical protein
MSKITGVGVEVVVDWGGSELHYLDGKLHREDEPAVTLPNGTEFYFLHNKLHREDGPAVTCPGRYEEYWLNGRLQRRYDSAVIDTEDKDE